ncbi:MAG: Gfo/Idh/MocA family oxidoreductase [Anaerolineae bacterium]|nr:Gfo/Idh/MocA family oxidoreductase [Anaerolineae bacterium]
MGAARRPPLLHRQRVPGQPCARCVAGTDTTAKREAFRTRWGVTALWAVSQDTAPSQEQLDLVAICTRAVTHARVSRRCGRGKRTHDLSPKREGDWLLRTRGRRCIGGRGERNPPRLCFNSGVLRHRRYHQARDLIAGGAIGEPRAAVHYAATNLLHGHVHSLDTISFLLGDPRIESVWGQLYPPSRRIENNRIDDKDPNGIYHVRFANGIEATTVQAGTWEFEILGTEGSLRLYNNGQGTSLRQIQGGRRGVFVEVPVAPVEEHSATQACLEDLVAAYEMGRATLGPVEVAYHITEGCLAVAESHQQGRRVSLPLQNRDLYVFHV